MKRLMAGAAVVAAVAGGVLTGSSSASASNYYWIGPFSTYLDCQTAWMNDINALTGCAEEDPPGGSGPGLYYQTWW